VIDAQAFVAAALAGLAVSAALAVAVWAASVKLRDVSIVDGVWSLLVFVPAAVAAVVLDGGPRAAVVLGLSGLWALRLAAHITSRHWGEPEDRRYRAIRARNQPRFELKSLYLVFGLQALLGAIVALPLQAAVASTAPWQPLDVLGLAVFAAGFAFETVADGQLARFKADPAQRGRVLDRGLWRFSRHPNYFGECCVWWGLWLVALAAGAWWTVVSPLLMTLLLLKVSGVTLLEKDIGERRPDYTDYVARTNAFVPGRPRT
jgi:steroid 5-alpha reductase family enzyme